MDCARANSHWKGKCSKNIPTLPCASTNRRASSEISQISPHFVPTRALDLTSVVMLLICAGAPDITLSMRML